MNYPFILCIIESREANTKGNDNMLFFFLIDGTETRKGGVCWAKHHTCK